ncbi:hypothetical protein [Chlorogloeopsis sp. ULAP02]|uniref:hypothetical protein n=1 Tax=Chlorogloeopsis sp. ULAP02 TaxID=3107926 RepID=UPI003136BB94
MFQSLAQTERISAKPARQLTPLDASRFNGGNPRNALAPLCRETLTYRSRLRRLRQSPVEGNPTKSAGSPPHWLPDKKLWFK